LKNDLEIALELLGHLDPGLEVVQRITHTGEVIGYVMSNGRLLVAMRSRAKYPVHVDKERMYQIAKTKDLIILMYLHWKEGPKERFHFYEIDPAALVIRGFDSVKRGRVVKNFTVTEVGQRVYHDD